METQKITSEWVKENLCMDDGNDITECYSDKTIDHISWLLRTWEDFDYKDEYELLGDFHLKYKQ